MIFISLNITDEIMIHKQEPCTLDTIRLPLEKSVNLLREIGNGVGRIKTVDPITV